MKNLDEFKKDVYERAEKAEAARAEKIKTFTRIGSIAAAFAVVIISVFAVIGPGFNVSYKANESVDSVSAAGSEIYAVVNEKGEIEFYAEITKDGTVKTVSDRSVLKEETKNSSSVPSKAAGDGSTDPTVNMVSVEEFRNIVNNLQNGLNNEGSSGAETVTEQQPSTTTAASDAAILPETTNKATEAATQRQTVVETTTTAARTQAVTTRATTNTSTDTATGADETTTTARTTVVMPTETGGLTPSIIKTVYEYSGQKRYASYFVAHTSDEFLRFAKSNGIDVPENEVTNKYVYSKSFAEFAAFVIPNNEACESVEITALTFDNGTLTLNYKLGGGTDTGKENAFIIFVYLPEGTTSIIIEEAIG